MVLITTFLVNVLCALVPCPPQFPGPEISDNNLIDSQADTFRHLRGTNNDTDSDNLQPFEIEPRVGISNGKVEGYFMKTVGGRRILAFEGIPYAEAPIGSRRFRIRVRIAWGTKFLRAFSTCSES
ncbi:unnamed protein product [Allacma fusca]|uniref:Carboxylesterase type B domain-containing protein n=1 Tax=Allacma fusca TaxID=39272 RepID=A0A8J2KYR6_9HEXA|nr:unnamed protein product [Allacma fusca]